MGRFALAIVMVLALPAPMEAGEFNDGVEAYGRGDYATALQLLRPLAQQGNAGAQNNLGVMYAQGHGVLPDFVQAWKWLSLAASLYSDKGDRDRAIAARDYVGALMTPAQITKAAKLVREWRPN